MERRSTSYLLLLIALSLSRNMEQAGNGVIGAHHSEPLHCAESVSDKEVLQSGAGSRTE
jgi:hypothetical protein